jgi:hypothetical protein
MHGQRNNILPLHPVGYTTPNLTDQCGCGCGGGGCDTPTENNYSVYKNVTRPRNLNGTFDDFLSNIVGNIGSGEPLVSAEVSISNDSLMKIGLVGLGLILINKNINKK